MKNFSLMLLSLSLLLVSPAISGCATTRTAGEQMDDATIHMRVGRRLAADPDVSRFKIDVDVLDAVVTLRGEVDSQAMMDEAVKLAQTTEGGKKVTNELVLEQKKQADDSRSDLSIKTAVGSRLSADPDVRRLNIDVDVVNGVVYLSGIVTDEKAKSTAERIASGVDGVTRVENELQVAEAEPATPTNPDEGDDTEASGAPTH